jgi:hypothetical protein
MSDFNLYSVNWQDGMLISRQHLKDQEAYFEELVRWYAGHVGDQYGLVRKSLSGKPALMLNMSVQGNRLRVEVIRCEAITPDGSFVEVTESGKNVVRAEAEIHEATVPVFLTVDPSLQTQIGDPDPSEDLPRMPFLMRTYALHLGTRPNVPEGRCLQLATLTVSGSEVNHAADYYPPCLTLYADERLVQKANEFRNRLEKLLSLSSQAYLAVASPGALAGEKTELQTAFKDTIYQIVYHLASTLDEFVIGRNAPHPLQLVVLYKRLFRVFSTLFNLYPGLKDYLNEKYFVKELNSDIGRFIASVESFIMTEYDHNDIGGHLASIDTILGTLRGSLGFLAQIKKEQLAADAAVMDTLTYNARTYRTLSYKGSRLEQVGELSYLVIEIAEPKSISDTVILMAKDLFSVAEWSHMQVRLGLNQARGLGETDPVTVDTTTYGNKVALRPQDMLKSPSVRQITVIFRGARESEKFNRLGKLDLMVYAI